MKVPPRTMKDAIFDKRVGQRQKYVMKIYVTLEVAGNARRCVDCVDIVAALCLTDGGLSKVEGTMISGEGFAEKMQCCGDVAKMERSERQAASKWL